MKEFAEKLIQAMLHWVQGVYAWFLDSIAGGENSGITDWLAANWVQLVIIIIVAGLVIDLLVWFFRNKPHRRVAAFFRQKPIEEIEAEAPQLRREKRKKKKDDDILSEYDAFNTDYFMALDDDALDDIEDFSDLEKYLPPSKKRKAAPVAPKPPAKKRPMAEPERPSRAANPPAKKPVDAQPARPSGASHSPYKKPAEMQPERPARAKNPPAKRPAEVEPQSESITAPNGALKKRRALRKTQSAPEMPGDDIITVQDIQEKSFREPLSDSAYAPPAREPANRKTTTSPKPLAQKEPSSLEPPTLRANWNGPRDQISDPDPSDPVYAKDTFVDNVQLPELPDDIPRVHVRPKTAPYLEDIEKEPEKMGAMGQFRDALRRGSRVLRRSMRTFALKARLSLPRKNKRDEEE